MKAPRIVVGVCISLLLLSACAVGPDYKRPEVSNLTPSDWHWKLAEPREAIPKRDWWKVFRDATLDELATNAVANNQNLRAAVARVDQARAVARFSRRQFFPELSLDPYWRRERTSGNLPTPVPIDLPSTHLTTYSVPLDLSYEVDLWGRVRRSLESFQAQAEGSVADYQNILLTLTADVAANYFLLRALDGETSMLRRTVEVRAEAVRILQERFNAGTLLEIDVARAKTELATAKVDLVDISRQRAETLHALALLCGKAPGAFELPERPLVAAAVVVPPGLPSSLLERRPDIARAERNLAARNAQIGVARSAYFPVVRLTGQAGFLSAEAESLFSSDSRVWSIGPSVSLPLFNAGRTAADVRRAEAAYQEAIAAYRQTVLTAFKEVEDSLAQIVLRNDQSVAQAEALVSARRAVDLAKARYEAGAGPYLDLLDAERTGLLHERRAVQLQSQQLVASVRLIKALGGGWEGEEPEGE